jgi:hypothetical protein
LFATPTSSIPYLFPYLRLQDILEQHLLLLSLWFRNAFGDAIREHPFVVSRRIILSAAIPFGIVALTRPLRQTNNALIINIAECFHNPLQRISAKTAASYFAKDTP